MRRKESEYIKVIQCKEVPAQGCTETVALAFAEARAVEDLGRTPETIEVFLSGNMLKNGMSVGIPGTGMYGLNTAAAIRVLGGRSEF